MKLSIVFATLVGNLLCISPIFGQDNSNKTIDTDLKSTSTTKPTPITPATPETKFLGDFKTLHHNVGGKIYSKGDNQLVIKDFTYDGKGNQPFFWTGLNSNEPNGPDGILLPHPFNGTFYEDRDDPKAPFLTQDGFDGSQGDIVLTLPDDIKVKALKWISVWCRELAQDFGSLNLPGAEIATGGLGPGGASRGPAILSGIMSLVIFQVHLFKNQIFLL